MRVGLVFIVGILLILLLGGTILWFVMSRWRGSALWKLCAFGGIAALLLLFIVAFLNARPSRRVTAVTHRNRPATVVLDHTSSNRSTVNLESGLVLARESSLEKPERKPPHLFGGGTAWLAEVDQEFVADVYPSARSAAKALGRKIKLIIDKSVDRVNETSESPVGTSFSIIQVSGSSGRHPAASLILGDLAEVMRAEFKSAEVLVESASLKNTIQDLKAVSIVIDVPAPLRQSKAVWESVSNRVELSGTLRANVKWRFGSFSTTARFVEKPWVTNFSAYLATRPKLQRLQAQSTKFANSEFEAREQAYRQAAVALLPILRQQLRELQMRQRPGRLIAIQESDERLISRLISEMHNGSHVIDRFPQRLTRPYGDIWRETVLVEISSPRLKYQTKRIHAASVARRDSLGNLIGKFVALIAFVCVFYFILNAATKGYYVWVIRGMMIGGVVVGGLLLMLWS